MGLYHNSIPYGELRNKLIENKPQNGLWLTIDLGKTQIRIDCKLPKWFTDELAFIYTVKRLKANPKIPKFMPVKLAHYTKSKIAKARLYQTLDTFS